MRLLHVPFSVRVSLGNGRSHGIIAVLQMLHVFVLSRSVFGIRVSPPAHN